MQSVKQQADIEILALQRETQALQGELQKETLARQAAQQEQLHLRRSQDALQEDLQKARLHATVSLPASSSSLCCCENRSSKRCKEYRKARQDNQG